MRKHVGMRACIDIHAYVKFYSLNMWTGYKSLFPTLALALTLAQPPAATLLLTYKLMFGDKSQNMPSQ